MDHPLAEFAVDLVYRFIQLFVSGIRLLVKPRRLRFDRQQSAQNHAAFFIFVRLAEYLLQTTRRPRLQLEQIVRRIRRFERVGIGVKIIRRKTIRFDEHG